MEAVRLKQRDIILVSYPYSDGSLQKTRPAIVVSNDEYNSKTNDVIVCAVTTKHQRHPYAVPITPADDAGVLQQPSLIRADGLARMHQRLAIKRIGAISERCLQKTKLVIGDLLSRKTVDR